ncbi:hypothetical protein H6P81_007538 [Aristolochia fimbriata]|uniref:Bidirectional sugar transporter SWEET n=1 Tax=Aristolochia fimbriata TaxID=158543 RepID=A0AAV7F170_ARIFI|nr:hypothetical protein H6P81_007538 [Aristolochia fimbriata]
MVVSVDDARMGVGILGNIISLSLFLSPVATMLRIWKRRSVESFSPLPYLATFINCLLWCIYGLPMVHPHSVLVITINGCGVLIELSYLIIFLLFSTGKQRTLTLLIFLFQLLFAAGVAIYVLIGVHAHQKRLLLVGSLCVFSSTMVYLAPLSVMAMVIRTKSVEFMPLSLSLTSFLNAICWTAYALLRFDLFITIPNGLGTVLALGQLILYAAFYKSTQQQLLERRKTAALTEMAYTNA